VRDIVVARFVCIDLEKFEGLLSAKLRRVFWTTRCRAIYKPEGSGPSVLLLCVATGVRLLLLLLLLLLLPVKWWQ